MRGVLLYVAGAVLALGITTRPSVLAQAPVADADPKATFEVASVKPNKSGAAGVRLGGPPGGTFTIENATLRDIIRFAYNVQPYQIEGGPGWIASDRFDIIAKQPPNTPPGLMATGSPSTLQYMVRNLLTDRFKLKMHQDTREMPVYALVRARSDGTLGPKLQPTAGGCGAFRRGGPGAAPSPPPRNDQIRCGMSMGIASLSGGDMPIAQLAIMLSPRVGRNVVDRTGLTGNYDFTLEFTPDPTQLPPGGTAPPGEPPLINGVPMQGPSIFTAVQEQLGLKLDSQRGPVDVWVIDSVEQPTQD
jgi:bla regulator protein blaR1